jgi:hypothetical protein
VSGVADDEARPDADTLALRAEVVRLRAEVARLQQDKAALLRAAAERDYERPPHYA